MSDLPEQKHDEAEQKDADDDGDDDDDDDDPQLHADGPLNLNVRDHRRHRLRTDNVTDLRTCDQELVGSTPGQVPIKWLLHGWATVSSSSSLTRSRRGP